MAVTTHAYCMTWSYAGLVAAGCGQLAVTVGGPDIRPWVVPVGDRRSAVAIFGRVPTVDRTLARVRTRQSPIR